MIDSDSNLVFHITGANRSKNFSRFYLLFVVCAIRMVVLISILRTVFPNCDAIRPVIFIHGLGVTHEVFDTTSCFLTADFLGIEINSLDAFNGLASAEAISKQIQVFLEMVLAITDVMGG